MSKRLTLPGMPVEILGEIATNLNDVDMTALHAVNSELYHKTKHEYAKRFFIDVHVFLHPLSFQKLSGLAKDDYYSKMVKHLTISTYVLRDKKYCRKGASTQLWDAEESFIHSHGAAAITSVLQRLTALKSFTISDFGAGAFWISTAMGANAIRPWGWNHIGQQLPIKRGPAVITSVYSDYDTTVWPLRVKAFEAILAGVEISKLNPGVHINLALEGNLPRPLTFPAQKSFLRTLSKVSHFAANFDSFADCEDSLGWLKEINPLTLCVDYDISHHEAPNETLNFHFGTYTRLTNLKITRAKGAANELHGVISNNVNTLQKVELKDICVNWVNMSIYPWCPIINTLASIKGMDYLWLSTLAAFPVGLAPFQVDPRASQETPWIGELNVSRAMGLLHNKYKKFKVTGSDYWVDMDHVDEGMMIKYHVYQ